MKKLSFYFITLFIASSVLFTACKKGPEAKSKTNKTEKVAINEFKILANYLESQGDFINSKTVPAMIKAKDVFKNLDNKKFGIIDLRNASDFAAGHIKNAVNVSQKDMINYFEKNITNGQYEKIIFISYSGQSASYTTGIMRLLGHNNVYAMKLGMSGWDKSLAKNYWSKHVSNNFASELETVSNAKAKKGAYPVIKTGKTTGLEILKVRAQNALNTSYNSLVINAQELFKNKANYYTMNYWPESKYDLGHIPGSIQYTPKKSLGTKTELSTLPIDKEIVTYCFTGQHAAFVTGYLNILGYKSKALNYGANSFMNKEMASREGDWHAFSEKKVTNHNLVK